MTCRHSQDYIVASGKGTNEMQQIGESAVSDHRPLETTSSAEGAKARTEAYGLLAGLLRNPPSAELLQLLADRADGPGQAQRPTDLQAAWTRLSEAARSADPAAVDDEFHKLFIGLGRGELLPYGSYYLTGFLMDKPLAALRDELSRLGIQRADGVSEPEDHAAAICETMVLLADPEHGIPLPGQQAFFSEYVGAWLPRFFSDVQGAKNADFYRSVGRLGEAFMEFERVWLSLPE
ncbi:TorD/DmsD family molecular chaperone [Wenzhouxiangella limi]|uniref:Molecular chaperone TorD n=1 Tax=Wenzhouxiangella limi TaxID=2707351 RepID=A0A845V6Q2_9GAMM|nr:molecular chaperone TorD family protein [Wenzhouxiangella limi]NDY95645.1 molecular chaperone TorD [Wenzhouxiangella limi]